MTGGGKFLRGQLYAILDNPIYRGEIRHGKKTYPGLHQAIIDSDLWDQVELKRQDNVKGHRSQYQAAHQSLLAGKLFDENGLPLIAMHACKGQKRYRYYVSQHLHHKRSDEPGWRIPAREVEGLVNLRLQELIGDPIGLLGKLKLALPSPEYMPALIAQAAIIGARVGNSQSSIMSKLVTKARISDMGLAVELSVNAICGLLKVDSPTTEQHYMVNIGARLTRTGVAMKLVQHNGNAPVKGAAVNTLLKTIARGHALWQQLRDDGITVGELARREGMTSSYLTRVLRLAFLDPHIIDQIIAGRQPAMLAARKLTLSGELPMRWNLQREFAGFNLTC